MLKLCTDDAARSLSCQTQAVDKSYVITGIGLAALLVATIAIQRGAGIKLGFSPLWAAIRAVVQLAAIALILNGILTKPWAAVLLLGFMMSVASWTSARRLAGIPRGTKAAVTGIVVAATLTILFVFLARMMEPTVPNIIAVGGILTGNAMSAATLTGRKFAAAARANRGEVEGWFALGATPVQAFTQIARSSVQEMLIPTIDTTKSTGLVTLPGAFVGALMGGASPAEAARFQLVVLVGIMFTQTVVGVVSTRILSQATVILPDEDAGKPKK